MKINYHNKLFRSIRNSDTGEVGNDTIFKYTQKDNIILGTYSGGQILTGQLVAMIKDDNSLEMRYQHINVDQEFKTGICTSVPEILPTGKIRLHETWQWTCDNHDKGESIIEEI